MLDQAPEEQVEAGGHDDVLGPSLDPVAAMLERGVHAEIVAELLGGVADEFKSAPLRPIRLTDGRLRLPGQFRLDQAAPLIGKAWSRRGDATGPRILADTVGGYVSEWLQRVPEPGEEIVIDGTPVEIEAVDSGAVTSLIVGPRPQVFEEDGR